MSRWAALARWSSPYVLVKMAARDSVVHTRWPISCATQLHVTAALEGCNNGVASNCTRELTCSCELQRWGFKEGAAAPAAAAADDGAAEKADAAEATTAS